MSGIFYTLIDQYGKQGSVSGPYSTFNNKIVIKTGMCKHLGPLHVFFGRLTGINKTQAKNNKTLIISILK